MENRDIKNADLIVSRPDRPAAAYNGFSARHDSLNSLENPGDNSIPGIADYIRILRKRAGTIILVTFVCGLLGIVSFLPQTPLYRATAQVEVQPLNEELGYSRDLSPSSSTGSSFPDFDLATEVKVLSTRTLLDRVILKLDTDPNLRIQPPVDRLAGWRQALHLPASPVPERRQAIEMAAASLQVKSSKLSRVIEIQCDSEDPKLAAAFANTVATEYIEQSIETRWQAAKHTGEWLSRQLDEIKGTLEKAEDQLQAYATAMNLVFAGDKDRTNVSQEKLSQVQAELSAAQGDRVSKQARYELATSGSPDALGQVVDDTTLRVYDSKLLDLRRELADLSSTLGPGHYQVKKVQAQITELEADQKKARQRIVDRITNDYKEADRREKLLQTAYQSQAGVLSEQAAKVTHYNILKREVETNRQLYESLLQKVKEAGIGAALRASNIQVIDRAQAPSGPFAPDLRKGVMLGLFMGLFGGVGLVVVQERINRRIEAPGETAFYLDVPELGVVPAWSIDKVAVEENRGRLFAGLLRRETGDPAITAFRRSQSLAAEAFRAIVTSILYVGRKRPVQVIVVSSPGASEGKTTVVSNLAMGFAETNRSVLVIDADMRRPRLHEIFNVPNETGLADLLCRREPLTPKDLLLSAMSTDFPGISVLPSGKAGSGAASLLHSVRMNDLIAHARQQFDLVLIDTPPILHLADARIVGSLADGVLLVVRAGQTSRDAVLSIKQRLVEDGVQILGSALNDWNPKAAGSYGYESYAHYYSSFYTKGGPNNQLPG
jgi:capsular exopolysaccharide synthesis family protein